MARSCCGRRGGLQLGDGGRYSARAVAEYGGPAPAAAEAKFTVQSGLEIEQLEVREQPGREPALRIRLHNTADLGLLPKLQLSVRDRAGRTFLSAVPVRVQLLPPGEPLEIVDVLPIQLPEGEYVLAARAEFGGTAADREVTFTIGTPAAAPDPAWAEGGHVAPVTGLPAVPGSGATKDGSWWSPGVLLALAALATVLLLTFLALRLLRARRAQLSDADEFGIETGPGKAGRAVPEPASEAERRVTSLLEEGQLAARSGDRFLAHRLFTRVVELDPAREEAWLWRAGTAEHSDEAIACLRRVLEINPRNRQAQQGLDALRMGTTAG